VSPHPRRRGSLAGRSFRFAVGLALLVVTPGVAQVIPWLGPDFDRGTAVAVAGVGAGDLGTARESTAAGVMPERRTSERKRPGRERARTAASAADEEIDLRAGPPLLFATIDPSAILLSGFSGGGGADGGVRTGTTWVGQVTQQTGTLTVGGTARDDNGWGATHLSVDASGMSYLNITAQRNAGNGAETLFVQFEDFSLRTKVVSVGTAQFAVGSMTVVQVPLSGWTIDFGPSQIVSWSLGGGGVGSVDFRMTFDSLAFSATAIPEPAAAGAWAALVACGAATWRRLRRRARRS